MQPFGSWTAGKSVTGRVLLVKKIVVYVEYYRKGLLESHRHHHHLGQYYPLQPHIVQQLQEERDSCQGYRDEQNRTKQRGNLRQCLYIR